MASVHKKAQSKYWFGYYRDLTGRLITRSTKQTLKKEAQRVADLWELTVQRKKSAQHIRAAFSNLYRDVYGQTLPVTTLKGFVELWLKEKKPTTSPATWSAYETTTKAFLSFLGERAKGDIADVSREQVLAFRNELDGRLASDTTNRYIKILRMLFKAAHRDRYVLENPVEYVQAVLAETGGSRRRGFTIAEIQAVLAVADPEWQSLIRFGLYTGQRLADLALLSWNNIDLARGEIRLVTKKTGRRLLIPIAEPLAEHIATLPASDSELRLHPRAFDAVTRQGRAAAISNWFSDLLAQAGLRSKQTHQARGIGRTGRRAASQLSFHSLRHTAVTLLKEAGVPQAVVQELIGHESAAMSQHYTHVGVEALRKAASSLPKV